MKKMLVALGIVAALSACGGGGDEAAPAEEATPVEEPATDDATDEATEEVAGDFDATAARATYEANCLACHGGNLEGAGGPRLAGEGHTPDQIYNVIVNGQGTMPAINLPADEAENLADWIAAQ
ncbi:c-type cytochrome [Alkalihalobacillus sp. MEB130]|uniref:c-type cytochrome n=1 Tax=Alkalihalobacillus sp. MEB130 TaxID=2976704 RepID=UPI0028DEDA17|nr:c-type cytochrome [Alkalihalobacillus sp. MEB130]MDT8858756.1 c-type cytochrome [Alkalihalobacillus sp. MEB130]